jgi:hypothetical protein
MDWLTVLQYVELCLAFVLVARLLSLGLHRVYRYFCVFLLSDISGTLVWAIDKRFKGTPLHFDYRIAWLGERFVAWVFGLLTVYALLDAILAGLPGILKLSRKVLNISFGGAIFIGLLTALPEYRASISTSTLAGRFAHVIAAAFVFDRVIASAALIALLCILLFLIWFPVEMSRNLVAFFGGFVVYFALQTCGELFLSLLSGGAPAFIRFIDMWSAVLVAAIFAYWTFSITKAGENVPAKLRVPTWQRREEDILIAQLEAMNTSLLRAVRR